MLDEGLEIVAVEDLKLGMFVAEPDRPWTELPFPLQGFVLSNPDEVREIADRCRFVYIDRQYSIGDQYAAQVREAGRRLQSQAFDHVAPKRIEETRRKRERFLKFLYRQDESRVAEELATEMARAEPQFESLQQSLTRTLENLRCEEKVDFRNVTERLDELSSSLDRNPDAVMWLMRLKKLDAYSYDQAMDVGIYLLLLGRHVGLAGDKLLELSTAGMLQDVGKTALPAELLTKSGALDADEQELIRSHVGSSLELLCMQGGVSTEIMMIVANHHERWDGSGYPRGLKLKEIGRGAEMAGLIDSFCAMMKSKPYRAAMGHQQALEALYNQRDKQFNPALMEQLVQCVGLYPIGTLVELNTGEVGIVIQQNRVQRARPRVLLMLDGRKQRVHTYHVIDLREPRYKDYYVLRSLPQDAYGLAGDECYLAG